MLVSNLSTEIFVSPGNPGTAQEKNKNVSLQNKDDVLVFKEKKIFVLLVLNCHYLKVMLTF